LKKLQFTVLLSFLFAIPSMAQFTGDNNLLLANKANYEPQNDFLHAGFGFSSWGLPIYATYEKPMFMERMSLVVGGSFRRKSFQNIFVGGTYDVKHTIIGFEGGVNYYFDEWIEEWAGEFPSEIDLYASLRLHYYIWNTRFEGDVPQGVTISSVSGGDNLGLGGLVGGRYHFNENLSLHLEGSLGSVISGGRIGLSFRL